MSQNYGLESGLDIIGSEKYGCDKQCVLFIIEPKKCDLDMIGTEKVCDLESVLETNWYEK